jgi:hypothetical protein
MAAEKVRAAFQRAKLRDLYDLHLLGNQKLDIEVLRRTAPSRSAAGQDKHGSFGGSARFHIVQVLVLPPLPFVPEDPLIVVLALKLCSGFLVDDDLTVAMQLQR